MQVIIVAAIMLTYLATIRCVTLKPPVTEDGITSPKTSEANILNKFLEGADDLSRNIAANYTTTTKAITIKAEETTAITPSNSTTNSTPTTTRRETSTQSDTLLKVCRKLPTHRLRVSCRHIAENSLIATMDKVYAFVDKNDEKKFARSETGRRTLSFGPLPIGEQNCETKCPSGDEWTGATSANERSFSPWRFCNHYDRNRLPQWIYYAKCQCSGCMNPMTREEDNNFLSVAIKTILPVIRKETAVPTFKDCDDKTCREETMEVSLGCHCVWPVPANA